MADSLYIKHSDGFERVDVGGGGGGSSSAAYKVFVSQSRDAVVSAGTAFTVPQYTMGSHSLSVYWDGLLTAAGITYTEDTSSTIKFADDLPADVEVIVVIDGSSTTAGTRARQVDDSRAAVLAAGVAYSVPEHSMSENRIRVWLDGLLADGCFEERSTTEIAFNSDIPKDMQIIIQTES